MISMDFPWKCKAHDLQHYYGSAETLVAACVPRWLVAEPWAKGMKRRGKFLLKSLGSLLGGGFKVLV